MADVHLPATRSYNMSRIKSKNTRPEMLVRRFLHARGFRYLLHAKKYFEPGGRITIWLHWQPVRRGGSHSFTINLY
jgi:G:T-mismatch repair DNA endonuclease (very short patch repair protein)